MQSNACTCSMIHDNGNRSINCKAYAKCYSLVCHNNINSPRSSTHLFTHMNTHTVTHTHTHKHTHTHTHTHTRSHTEWHTVSLSHRYRRIAWDPFAKKKPDNIKAFLWWAACFAITPESVATAGGSEKTWQCACSFYSLDTHKGIYRYLGLRDTFNDHKCAR